MQDVVHQPYAPQACRKPYISLSDPTARFKVSEILALNPVGAMKTHGFENRLAAVLTIKDAP